MRRYVEHKGCLMEFLARALDDPNAAPCGKCMNCANQTERRTPPRESGDSKPSGFLRGDALVLEPRLRWPKPLLEELHTALPDAVECFGDSGRPRRPSRDTPRCRRPRVVHLGRLRLGR